MLITGVLTPQSIAFAAARVAQEQGAEIVLTGFGKAMSLTEMTARRLLDRMEGMSADPRPPGCEKLAEVPDAFRVRVGNYRIVYRVDDAARVVEVIRVGQRASVYRRR